MANYYGKARSNYVKVEDIEGLKKVLAPWDVKIETDATGRVALIDENPDGYAWPKSSVDEDGDEVELDPVSDIMPFVKEGEVLIIMEAGHEAQRCVWGVSTAYIRRGGDVDTVHLSLNDIDRIAAERFGVPLESISVEQF